jgi:hypothetical protein
VISVVVRYARWLAAVLIPSRKAEDLFAGWRQLLERVRAAPRVLVRDGEGAIGRWRGGRSELTRESGVPRNAGRNGAGLPAGQTRRPRA